jgi:hypothetical protein
MSISLGKQVDFFINWQVSWFLYLNISFNQSLNFGTILSLVLICYKFFYIKHFGKSLFVFGVGLISWTYLGMGLQSVMHSPSL